MQPSARTTLSSRLGARCHWKNASSVNTDLDAAALQNVCVPALLFEVTGSKYLHHPLAPVFL